MATYYVDQLLTLSRVNNSNELELFMDRFLSSVSALKQLKLKNLLELLLIRLGTSKLDKHTINAFETKFMGQNEIPTFAEFSSFLSERVKLLNRTTQTVEVFSQRKTTSKHHTQTFVNLSTNHKHNTKCIYCNKNDHTYIYKCPDFLKLEPKSRLDLARNKKLCFNCLSSMHMKQNCKSNFTCHICKLSHHTLLHIQSNKTPSVAEQIADVSLCSVAESSQYFQKRTILLSTAVLKVRTAPGKWVAVRALIDNASQNDFITETCCKRLGYNIFSNTTQASVRGIGNATHPVLGISKLQLFSRHSSYSIEVEPLVVDRITDKLPTTPVNIEMLSYLQNVPLADSQFHLPKSIDMVLGSQWFPVILKQGRVEGPPGCPHALETSFGFIVMGLAPANEARDLGRTFCAITNEPAIETLMAKFWELEKVQDKRFLSPDEQQCENLYSQSTTRDSSGRYTVSLPFNKNPKILGDSFLSAERRFYSLEKRILLSPSIKQDYDNVIIEYLNRGYLTQVTESTHSGYYIPHHPIIREDKSTTKVRIVLDASAKSNSGLALNDILHSGKNLQFELTNILLNLRFYPIILSADVKQMYHQIIVKEEHRCYQRILYRFKPNEDLKIYEFTRVCFGLKCSPFLALRTIRQLASDECHEFPQAAEVVNRDIYMDDVATSVSTVNEAVTLSRQLIDLFKAGGFDLVKFTSNSSDVLKEIPESSRLSQNIQFGEKDLLKILGLCWDPAQDVFTFRVNMDSHKCTKRTMLSTIARLWDIMGFVAPVILYAKLLVKQLWLLKIDWDNSPPQEIQSAWEQFVSEMSLLECIKIPRHVNVFQSNCILTVVGFSDASEAAYGGVVYLHVENMVNNSFSVKLLCAKSKVAPVQSVTLARLELCAALLLSNLIRAIYEIYSKRHKINKTVAFSDSTVTLAWIHSSPHRWQTFVANRVAKIHENMNPEDFFHISGKENPADCLSRGLTPSQFLIQPLWMEGPSWLKQRVQDWPMHQFKQGMDHPPEEKTVCFLISQSKPFPLIYDLALRVSSWPKLLRILIYIFKFIRKLPRSCKIEVTDMELVECEIIKALQHVHFQEFFHTGKPSSAAFRNLSPFIQNGLIRVGGRLSNANIDYDSQHPILLPGKDHLTNLIIDYYHHKYLHTGPQLLLSLLRQKFWILSARGVVRSRIHKCVTCFKVSPKPTFPSMADLPKCRVNESKPFVHTGVDYAGPFFITVGRYRGTRKIKAYLCLFVCMVTRAVHIELAMDLSTQSFLNAFKRFIARRGPCLNLYSDCGTNFIGAKAHLDALYKLLASNEFNDSLRHELLEQRINWKMNSPAAPHFGGLWEGNVKSFKTHIYKIVGTQLLTYEEFNTIIIQIEALLNSRPMSALSSSPQEPLALTPAHFLTYTPLKSLPAIDTTSQSLTAIGRKHLLDHMVQSFWKRWRIEYLTTLQARGKWTSPSNPVKVGMVVVVVEENNPPLQWPLGVIEGVFPGKDGIVRVVQVRTKTGLYKRPVVKLCPLPVDY
jgi:hypothetical protein